MNANASGVQGAPAPATGNSHVDNPSAADLDALFDHYLAHGCPCRFPRFRAAVARDTKNDAGVWDWDVSDVGWLLGRFDRRVPVVAIGKQDFATQGRCELCGAAVLRFGIPVFKDSFIERAHITPGLLADVGAAEAGLTPICGTVFRAGPGRVSKGEAARIQNASPRLSTPEWLIYMGALAP